MNAINHAATALLIKSKYPQVPIIPILISVQFIEIIWVVLNILGVESTEFSNSVSSLADVHLVHMPFSHSLLFTCFWAALAWIFVSKVLGKPKWGIAISVGVFSHIFLDVLTHSFDIELIPFIGLPEIGTGLYSIPLAALAFELLYCVFVWTVIKGSLITLTTLLVLNLFSISFYLPQFQGPEGMLVNYPFVFAPVIGVHIIFGLISVWFLHNYEIKTPDSLLKSI